MVLSVVSNQDTDNLEDEQRCESESLKRRIFLAITAQLTRCCTFTYRNNTQLVAAMSFALIFVLGILKVVFGVFSVSNGQAAIVLAGEKSLNWAGIFLLIVGASSIVIGFVSFRRVTYRKWPVMTSKPIYGVIFCMFYVVLFDAIGAILVSGLNSEDFVPNLQTHLKLSLEEKYDVSSENYKLQWDNLQRSSQCCGVVSYTDWFGSVWADKLKAINNSTTSPLPLSCRYENLPNGPCFAISGTPLQPSCSHLSLSNFTETTTCDVFAVKEGRLDYIYATSCLPVYLKKLVDEMLSVMRLTIGMTVIDFAIIVTLASVANNLPFQHRVHVYNSNSPG